MSAVAFINIKLNQEVYYNGEIKEGGQWKKFANNSTQIFIGVENRHDIHQYFYKNQCWYLGCYFIKNPLYKIMTLQEFEQLLKYTALKLGFNEEGKRYFKGDSYEKLFVQIEKFMDRLINTLDDKTNKKWSYKDCDDYRKDFGKIKQNLQKIDQFVNENSK